QIEAVGHIVFLTFRRLARAAINRAQLVKSFLVVNQTVLVLHSFRRVGPGDHLAGRGPARTAVLAGQERDPRVVIPQLVERGEAQTVALAEDGRDVVPGADRSEVGGEDAGVDPSAEHGHLLAGVFVHNAGGRVIGRRVAGGGIGADDVAGGR